VAKPGKKGAATPEPAKGRASGKADNENGHFSNGPEFKVNSSAV
jgi:hypothetical protein